MRRGTGVLLAAALCFALLPRADAAEVTVSAQSAVLMEAESGRVLYAKDADTPRLIASTTKLMTALVALESGHSLEEVVTIPAEAAGVEGSSLYLKAGETVKLKTLLYGMLLQSGNDAATAVALYCAGSLEAFAQKMNEKAQQLGMTNSHFTNPTGLDGEEHYSSAYDMALLARACLDVPELKEITATRSTTMEGRTFVNHNKLLWRYEGCVGMKTGYTQAAGRTLVSSAERNGQTLVCVTLNDRDDWNDHKALLDYGFSAFPRQVLAEEGEELGRVPLQGSLLHMASVEARETVAYPLKQGEEVTMEVDLPDQAEAPVVQGEIAGSVRFLVGSRQVGQTYLVWSGSARRDVVKERPVDSPLDFLPQSTPPTYEEMLSLFSKAGTVSE